MAQAAAVAGVSLARWSHIENGHETRQGTTRPVKAKADTLARMARAISLSPERLESEGQRPDAAEILREILRTPPEGPATERPLAAVPGPGVLPDDPSDKEVVLFIARQPDPGKQELLAMAWTLPGAERKQRLEMVRGLTEDPAAVAAREEREERRREQA